jgi:hypothetical protein
MGARQSTCAICMQPVCDSDSKLTRVCGHGFHEACILEWSKKSVTCPLCRDPYILT